MFGACRVSAAKLLHLEIRHSPQKNSTVSSICFLTLTMQAFSPAGRRSGIQGQRLPHSSPIDESARQKRRSCLLPRSAELLVRLIPINSRKDLLDGIEKVFPVQRLERHVLVANVELHLLNQRFGFRKHPVEFAIWPCSSFST